jgi:hypothetical protein
LVGSSNSYKIQKIDEFLFNTGLYLIKLFYWVNRNFDLWILVSFLCITLNFLWYLVRKHRF